MRIEEAVANAQRQFLGLPGITGVSYRDNTIVVYVADEQAARQIPFSFMGFSVEVVITGRFEVL